MRLSPTGFWGERHPADRPSVRGSGCGKPCNNRRKSPVTPPVSMTWPPSGRTRKRSAASKEHGSKPGGSGPTPPRLEHRQTPRATRCHTAARGSLGLVGRPLRRDCLGVDGVTVRNATVGPGSHSRPARHTRRHQDRSIVQSIGRTRSALDAPVSTRDGPLVIRLTARLPTELVGCARSSVHGRPVPRRPALAWHPY
ncbi:hypothetical protein BMS3Abin02_02201 [bacterium BMS3Abin02]|nr:hypothetical protein BMS3Abin02_02201 [bacterium BMS3Abin02]